MGCCEEGDSSPEATVSGNAPVGSGEGAREVEVVGVLACSMVEVPESVGVVRGVKSEVGESRDEGGDSVEVLCWRPDGPVRACWEGVEFAILDTLWGLFDWEGGWESGGFVVGCGEEVAKGRA